MTHGKFMSAREAARALGISRSTLYSYVSRGLVRSEPAGEGQRRHRYLAEDVRRLQQRKQQRHNPAAAAAQALDWGAPVLESAITLIAEGAYYYRGHNALDLAEEAAVEEVAGLIWTGKLDSSLFTQESAGLPPGSERLLQTFSEMAPTERFQAALPLAGSRDYAAYELRQPALLVTGVRLLHLLVGLAAGRKIENEESIAGTLQQGWQLPPPAQSLLSMALIVCADHELNVSAFTARCVASAGGTLYGVVQAGLAALQGVHHGGYTERVEALLAEVGRPERAQQVLAARLKRGERIPGFGHPLYPDGDPRARLLLQRVADDYGESEAAALVEAVVQAARGLVGRQPTVDIGLVAVAQALALPPGSALALFALGRSIGWIGHALEQYDAGNLIRPRARYIGPAPGG